MLLNNYIRAKKGSVSISFWKAKPFFFSGLIAYSQRNDHFCGCKGTKIFYSLQINLIIFNTLKPQFLIFMTVFPPFLSCQKMKWAYYFINKANKLTSLFYNLNPTEAFTYQSVKLPLFLSLSLNRKSWT